VAHGAERGGAAASWCLKVVAGIDDGGHDYYRLCVDLHCVLLLLRCGFVVLQGAWRHCNG